MLLVNRSKDTSFLKLLKSWRKHEKYPQEEASSCLIVAIGKTGEKKEREKKRHDIGRRIDVREIVATWTRAIRTNHYITKAILRFARDDCSMSRTYRETWRNIKCGGRLKDTRAEYPLIRLFISREKTRATFLVEIFNEAALTQVDDEIDKRQRKTSYRYEVGF